MESSGESPAVSGGRCIIRARELEETCLGCTAAGLADGNRAWSVSMSMEQTFYIKPPYRITTINHDPVFYKTPPRIAIAIRYLSDSPLKLFKYAPPFGWPLISAPSSASSRSRPSSASRRRRPPYLLNQPVHSPRQSPRAIPAPKSAAEASRPPAGDTRRQDKPPCARLPPIPIRRSRALPPQMPRRLQRRRPRC
jgi:hypothetical protein